MQVALLLKSNNYKCSKIVRSYNSIEQPEFSYSTNLNITILEECLAESFKGGYVHFSWHRNSTVQIPEDMSRNDSVSTSHNRPNPGSA